MNEFNSLSVVFDLLFSFLSSALSCSLKLFSSAILTSMQFNSAYNLYTLKHDRWQHLVFALFHSEYIYLYLCLTIQNYLVNAFIKFVTLISLVFQTYEIMCKSIRVLVYKIGCITTVWLIVLIEIISCMRQQWKQIEQMKSLLKLCMMLKHWERNKRYV